KKQKKKKTKTSLKKFAKKAYASEDSAAGVTLMAMPTATSHWDNILPTGAIAHRKMQELDKDPVDGSLKADFTSKCRSFSFAHQEKAPWQGVMLDGLLTPNDAHFKLKGTPMTAADFHLVANEGLGRLLDTGQIWDRMLPDGFKKTQQTKFDDAKAGDK